LIDFVANYSEEARQELVQHVKSHMSEKRFKHVLGVEKAAMQLAKDNGVSVEKASIAALTHDYAKERSQADFFAVIDSEGLDPDLKEWSNAIWHGVVGAYLVERELGINDTDILHAITVHTTGAAEMTPLDKVIYVADYIEPGRDFPGVNKARALAKENLDAAVAYETKQTLAFLIEKEARIYPKTIETYNRWVAQKQ